MDSPRMILLTTSKVICLIDFMRRIRSIALQASSAK